MCLSMPCDIRQTIYNSVVLFRVLAILETLTFTITLTMELVDFVGRGSIFVEFMDTLLPGFQITANTYFL